MDPYNLVQIADDTIWETEFQETLASKFESLRTFSNRKLQSINIATTMYVCMYVCMYMCQNLQEYNQLNV